MTGKLTTKLEQLIDRLIDLLHHHQEPEGTGHVFKIDEKTGKLYVKEPTLDRGEPAAHSISRSVFGNTF